LFHPHPVRPSAHTPLPSILLPPFSFPSGALSPLSPSREQNASEISCTSLLSSPLHVSSVSRWMRL
jgi:hypothetical protein